MNSFRNGLLDAGRQGHQPFMPGSQVVPRSSSEPNGNVQGLCLQYVITANTTAAACCHLQTKTVVRVVDHSSDPRYYTYTYADSDTEGRFNPSPVAPPQTVVPVTPGAPSSLPYLYKTTRERPPEKASRRRPIVPSDQRGIFRGGSHHRLCGFASRGRQRPPAGQHSSI